MLKTGLAKMQNLFDISLKKPFSCRILIKRVVTKRLGTSLSNQVFNVEVHNSKERDPNKKQRETMIARNTWIINEFTSIIFMQDSF